MFNLKSIDFVSMFQRIPASRVPVFGTMHPPQIANHLLLTLKLSYGAFEIPAITDVEKAEKVKRIILGNNRPFPKGMVLPGMEETSVRLGILPYEPAMAALNMHRDIYYSYYELSPEATNPHPAMGPLNFSEWEIFHFKHFTHHLSQLELEF